MTDADIHNKLMLVLCSIYLKSRYLLIKIYKFYYPIKFCIVILYVLSIDNSDHMKIYENDIISIIVELTLLLILQVGTVIENFNNSLSFSLIIVVQGV